MQIVTKRRAKPKGAGKSRKAWADYEDVARYVLQRIGKRFGLADVQGKQLVVGRRTGTAWEIDAKGVRDGDGAIILVECRRHGSRIHQEAVAAIAFRIQDTGAAGGIIVSPLPLQKGAKKVASATGIQHVKLRPESTREFWIAEIEKVVHIERTERAKVAVSEAFEITIKDAAGNVVDRRCG
jgi:hypothetical protein